MKVRVVHMGQDHWLVQDQGQPGSPVYSFDPAAPYQPLGLAAQRNYVAWNDLIEVDEADLERRT